MARGQDRFEARQQAEPAAGDGPAGAVVVVGFAGDGGECCGDSGFPRGRVCGAGNFGVEHGKLGHGAAIAMFPDERGGSIAIGAGIGCALSGERDAGAEQMRLRQEQRHGTARGDVFGLAERFAGGVRIAAAPERFGMGEEAGHDIRFLVGAAQGGESFGGTRGAVLRRGLAKRERPPTPRGSWSACQGNVEQRIMLVPLGTD